MSCVFSFSLLAPSQIPETGSGQSTLPSAVRTGKAHDPTLPFPACEWKPATEGVMVTSGCLKLLIFRFARNRGDFSGSFHWLEYLGRLEAKGKSLPFPQ